MINRIYLYLSSILLGKNKCKENVLLATQSQTYFIIKLVSAPLFTAVRLNVFNVFPQHTNQTNKEETQPCDVLRFINLFTAWKIGGCQGGVLTFHLNITLCHFFYCFFFFTMFTLNEVFILRPFQCELCIVNISLLLDFNLLKTLGGPAL